jgi:hypothetical protein
MYIIQPVHSSDKLSFYIKLSGYDIKKVMTKFTKHQEVTAA